MWIGFHCCNRQYSVAQAVWWRWRTLVLRVRFRTGPALMMRSNSKQPFWLTGDMTPVLCAWAWRLQRRGCAGVLSFMGVGVGVGKGAMGIGLAGVCCALSAMAAGSLHQAAGSVYVAVAKGNRRATLGAIV